MSTNIDETLVRCLIATQIPQWKHFSVYPVPHGGWDNKTFRLGEHMLVRLPSAADYAVQVEKEHRWLPILAPLLPLEIPVPLILGVANESYPCKWSIYRWLDGETVTSLSRIDLNKLVVSLAKFLIALQHVDPTGGPLPGPRNFYRGGSLKVYDAETRQAIIALKGRIDTDIVTEIWETACATSWHRSPVWVHGDIAAGNLLMHEGELNAVIDFGQLAIGDPACDLVIAWTLLKDESRELFRNIVEVDAETWDRGRAWALWKALIIAAGTAQTNAFEARAAWHIINEIISDYKSSVNS